jgi:type IX secretion system PorP/SprF family membrane protein
MKKIHILLLTLVLSITSYAQQEFMITHYMYNGLALNPAYAGVHEGISTGFLLREQWVGFPGAPSTQLATIHGPLAHRPVSLGAVIFRDKLGLGSELGAYFSYAYRIQLNDQLKLSFGLQASGHNYRIDYAEDDLTDPGDNIYNVSEMKWNFGSGLLLHTDRLYVGFSVPQMLNKKLDTDATDGTFSRLVRHYYLTAGYAFDWGPNLVVKPNLLVKAVPNAPLQMDLNANVLIKEKVWLGASYRSLDSVDGLIALQVNPQLQIGYSVDITHTAIDATSHEIMINYVFHLPTTKIVTPRYF